MSWGRWGSRYLNAITLSGHTGLLIASFIATDNGSKYDTWFLFAVVSMFLSLFAWLFNYRRLLAIAEHPTSTIAGVAQGYVELLGRAHNLLPQKSPLQGKECVWFRYWVYAKDHNNVWKLADYRSSEQNFEIEDATGRCIVNPTGAEVIAADRHQIVQNDHKYIEELLCNGGTVYVLGKLETITEQNAAQQIKREVGQLLAEWKKSPVNFKFRFDRNGDGEIDMHEWEQARAQATMEVLDKKGILNKEEVHLIRAPDDGRTFLISGISPYKLRQRYKFWIRLHLSVGMLACMVILFITSRQGLVALW